MANATCVTCLYRKLKLSKTHPWNIPEACAGCHGRDCYLCHGRRTWLIEDLRWEGPTKGFASQQFCKNDVYRHLPACQLRRLQRGGL